MLKGTDFGFMLLGDVEETKKLPNRDETPSFRVRQVDTKASASHKFPTSEKGSIIELKIKMDLIIVVLIAKKILRINVLAFTVCYRVVASDIFSANVMPFLSYMQMLAKKLS